MTFWTDDRLRDLLRLQRQKQAHAWIAERLGCSEEIIKEGIKHLRFAGQIPSKGRPKKPREFTPQMNVMLEQRYIIDRWSVRRIAREFGMSEYAITEQCRVLGLTRDLDRVSMSRNAAKSMKKALDRKHSFRELVTANTERKRAALYGGQR